MVLTLRVLQKTQVSASYVGAELELGASWDMSGLRRSGRFDRAQDQDVCGRPAPVVESNAHYDTRATRPVEGGDVFGAFSLESPSHLDDVLDGFLRRDQFRSAQIALLVLCFFALSLNQERLRDQN